MNITDDVIAMHAQFLERRDQKEGIDEQILETLDFLVDLQVLHLRILSKK